MRKAAMMSKLSVDFHTHILHNVDDGSSSLSESVKMLKAEQKMGVKTVVATPHFYADLDSADEFLHKRAKAVEELNRVTADMPELPRIVQGAEVLYFEGMDKWDILPELTISGTKYIIIEMPCTPFPRKSVETLANFKKKTGFTPIIAHLDRYITAFRTYKLPEVLSELDVLVQMNASFFLKFPNAVQAIKLLKKGSIHLLGSDCHNNVSRPPNLDKAESVILEKAGRQYINRLIEFENLILGE